MGTKVKQLSTTWNQIGSAQPSKREKWLSKINKYHHKRELNAAICIMHHIQYALELIESAQYLTISRSESR